MSQHTYFLCDKCKRISRVIFINNDLTAKGICRCGLNNRVDQSDRLYELDQAIRRFGGVLVYHFPGSIEMDSDDYIIHLPMMRYRDVTARTTISDFIRTYFNRYNIGYSWDLARTDTGLKDLLFTADLKYSKESDAKKVLSEHRQFFNNLIDWLIEVLNAIESARREDAKKEAAQSFGLCMPIRDTKKYYYCPECGNIGYIGTDTHWSERMVEQHGKFSSSVTISEPVLTNDVKCVACDEFMIELDSDIALRIKSMNDHGIMTIYCCQGHYVNEHTFQLPKDPNADNYKIDHHIDLPYVTFFANERDNKELVDIVADMSNKRDIYPHINVAFVDEFHTESACYERVYINTDVDDISEGSLNITKAEFVKFLDELIERYGNVKS